MTNEDAIKKFAETFNFTYGQTEHVNTTKVRDGWVTAGTIDVGGTEVGFTVVCYGNGIFKAFAEIAGGRDMAVTASELFARIQA